MAIIVTAKVQGFSKVYSKTVKSDAEMANWIKIQSYRFQEMGIAEHEVEYNFVGLR